MNIQQIRGDEKINIIFDLDGTLANTHHRDHFIEGEGKKDWDSFAAASVDDEPYKEIAMLARELYVVAPLGRFEIWTAREDKWRDITEKWLKKNQIFFDQLRMRPEGYYGSSESVKQKFLDECGFVPDIVFEDRAKMVKFFRDKGITCLQVADHRF